MDYFVIQIPGLCGCHALQNMSYHGFWCFTIFFIIIIIYEIIYFLNALQVKRVKIFMMSMIF